MQIDNRFHSDLSSRKACSHLQTMYPFYLYCSVTRNTTIRVALDPFPCTLLSAFPFPIPFAFPPSSRRHLFPSLVLFLSVTLSSFPFLCLSLGISHGTPLPSGLRVPLLSCRVTCPRVPPLQVSQHLPSSNSPGVQCFTCSFLRSPQSAVHCTDHILACKCAPLFRVRTHTRPSGIFCARFG